MTLRVTTHDAGGLTAERLHARDAASTREGARRRRRRPARARARRARLGPRRGLGGRPRCPRRHRRRGGARARGRRAAGRGPERHRLQQGRRRGDRARRRHRRELGRPAHLAVGGGEGGRARWCTSRPTTSSTARCGAPYDEDDPARPLAVYGLSKRAGEMAVTSVGGAHLVVRTSALFGHGGNRVEGRQLRRPHHRARAVRHAAARGGRPGGLDDVRAGPRGRDRCPGRRRTPRPLPRRERGDLHLALAGGGGAAAGGSATRRWPGGHAREELGAPAPAPALLGALDGAYRSRGLPPLRDWRAALADHLANV